MNDRAFALPKSRHWLMWSMLFMLFLGLGYRVYDLQVLRDDYLQVQGDKRSIRTVPVRAYRGMILDRHGEPLAVSTPVQSIWVAPSKADYTNPKWQTLCHLLDMDSTKTLENLRNKQNKNFVYLRRQLTPQLAQKVLHLNLEGVYAQKEYRRYYPMGEVTAQLVGTTNVDEKGIEGMELAFNEQLSGQAGEKKILKNRLGEYVEALGGAQRGSLPGQDVQLSIDSRIQYLAYKELLKAVNQHQAKSGSVVVLDAKSFEVLAMANVPSYNPNHAHKPLDGRIRNRAVTDQFEPGSLMKPFSLIPVLESGRYYPHTQVDTSPGWLKIHDKIVRDVRNYGRLDVARVIEKSSNVGISKLVLSIPPDQLFDTLDRVGFGYRTTSNFPGEVSGHIQYGGMNNPFALATLAFGYGISATPLQIAHAYAILSAQGVKRTVSLLKKNTTEPGEQVIPGTVAQAVTQMLVGATGDAGTARRAQIPGFSVAGKTGTARKVGQSGYKENSHVALFAGFAPAYQPEVVISVVIDEPKGKYYGGQVAAPVFSKIMQGALRLMKVSPYSEGKGDFYLVKK